MIFQKKDKPKKPLFRRIINAVIYSAVGFIILLLVAFGISQTSTFRNWLKETLVEEVNAATNGELAIGEIQGTIFTSIILNNISYNLEGDTLISAQMIELRTSPLKMLFKIVYLRKFEIVNAKINLLKDKNGELNISRIVPPSEEVDEDTTSSDFSLKFEVADLSLNNIDLKFQSVDNKNSTAFYDHPNLDDFRINDINLSLYAFADISGSEFKLQIDQLSAKPNLNNFSLENFEGNFLLHGEDAHVGDFNIITTNTELTINAALSGYNLLGENNGKTIEDAQLKLELKAEQFNFDDLTTFITATELLNGTIGVQVDVSGSLNELSVDHLMVEGENTKLEGSGRIINTTAGETMNIDFRFLNSFVDQNFSNNLLHTIDLPVYEELGLLRFDTLYFKGRPLDFISGINLKTEKGNINVTSKLNVENDLIYDIGFTTKNLDLNSFAGIESILNSKGTIRGSGTDPETMVSEINIAASNSIVYGSNLQNLKLNTTVKNGNINSDINFVSDSLLGKLDIKMLMNNFDHPEYSFKGDITGFDISKYEAEPTITSNINFYLEGQGENLDPEKLNLFLSLSANNSTLNNILIDSTRMIVDIRSDSTERLISIISDLADVTLIGRFAVEDLINVINLESNIIAQSIEQKINEIQPFIKIDENITVDNITDTQQEFAFETITDDISLSFNVEFKDFTLLSLFLGQSEIEIDGDLSGNISMLSDTIKADINAEINYFKLWDGNELVFVSQLRSSVQLNDKLSDIKLESISAEMDASVKRLFMGSEFDDFNLMLSLNNSIADIELISTINNKTKIDVKGNVNFEEDKAHVLLDKFSLVQNKYEIINDGKIDLSYARDNVIINRFKLTHDPGVLEVKGEFSLTGDENLSINLTDFELKEIGTLLLDLPSHKSPDAVLSLNLNYSGTAFDPVIDLELRIDSVKFNDLSLGSFAGGLNYKQESLTIDVDFNENREQQEFAKLKIVGNLPINLSLNAEELLIKNRDLKINFMANNFDMKVLNAAVPILSNLKGILNADVSFAGSFDDVISNGSININDGSFVLEPNNLPYNYGIDLKFENNNAIIEEIQLTNRDRSKGGGVMVGRGSIVHQNFIPSEIELYLNGELRIFGSETRAVLPTLYGDITVKTIGDISYLYNSNINKLTADISINKGANLTYAPTQTAFSNESDKFVYVFEELDTVKFLQKQIDSLIVESESKREESSAAGTLPFDLDIKIRVEDEIKTIFVLSREFNQNLTAYLGGTFEYILINEQPVAQGELLLLEGSKLEFIKTFQAVGSIKFYGELDNPFLNITASYQNYYNVDSSRTSSGESEVLIQIKLDGPLKTLNTNFVKNEENIVVYKRTSGRGQFEIDPTKTASDAMMFIIVGKFTEDATTQETNLAVSTAASLAGSIVGGYLNEELGDYVRSVEVSQVGTETKFSLIGRAGDFRYEIGGTSQMFQDLSRANIKIEVPPFKKVAPALILRLERREPIFESSTSSQMINELGLKYNFEF